MSGQSLYILIFQERITHGEDGKVVCKYINMRNI